ncbi:unnamed protein product [Pleuronectes platessa]|uniref:Uncharacterized protein n=1 Tax=Pleuronectes platessa TaxID=8262 RepID=A0A9N7TJ18_PLEPL|nr:unnamed protein product [Pleuronectes platessa]
MRDSSLQVTVFARYSWEVLIHPGHSSSCLGNKLVCSTQTSPPNMPPAAPLLSALLSHSCTRRCTVTGLLTRRSALRSQIREDEFLLSDATGQGHPPFTLSKVSVKLGRLAHPPPTLPSLLVPSVMESMCPRPGVLSGSPDHPLEA